MAIGQYRVVSFDKHMQVGVAGAMQVTVSAVAKTNGPSAPYAMPNELICAELARFIRLPVPPSGIVRPSQPGQPLWFASMDFNLTGNSLPPVDLTRCWADLPNLSTGLLLFDILVANCDRHRGNFAVDWGVSPPQMSVFDHSHALFGYQTGQGVTRLADLKTRLGASGGSRTGANRHCLLDVVSTDDYFGEWIERIKALPDFLIDGLCQDAIELGASNSEADAAADFLKYRRDSLSTIIRDHRAEFSSISQWRLLP